MAKTLGTRRQTRLAALSALAILAVYYGVRIALFITGKPVISVNYAIEYNERMRPVGYDPNDDATPYFRDALAQLPAMPPDIPSIGRLWVYKPSSTEWKIVEEWINSSSKALDILDQGSQKPCLWVELPTIDFHDPAPTQGLDIARLRAAAFCLRYKAEYLSAQGDIPGAFRWLITLSRMARHLGNSGGILVNIGQMMDSVAYTTTFELLARTDVDSSLLGKVQRQFEEVLSTKKPPQFQGDEVLLWDAVQRYFTDNGKADGHLVVAIVYDHYLQENAPRSELAADAAYLRYLRLAWRHPSRRQTMRTIQGLTESASRLAGQTPWELHTKGTSHADPLKDAVNGNYFLQHIMADTRLGGTIGAFYRVRASTEALITTMGILRFRKDKGRLPQSLDELAASGYIRRVHIDPYSDGPLVYKLMEDSFTLYSHGRDFDDDGGVHSSWGRSPDGGDQVFWPLEERKK